MNAIVNIKRQMVSNLRTLNSIFGQFFPDTVVNGKHNYAIDFGYPGEITFDHCYQMYLRNGVGRAAVEKTIQKSWQDMPWILQHARDGSKSGEQKETLLERALRKKFIEIRFWPNIVEADRRSLVGRYSALLIRVRDGQTWDKPLTTVKGGLNALVELIPVWEKQLQVVEWETDLNSENYGEPKMYTFVEQFVGDIKNSKKRQFTIHPSRVIIWSKDGTLDCDLALSPGYNDLVSIEKVIGAGGEGFWKNAKSAPIFEIDKEADLVRMAEAMNTTVDKIADVMDKQVQEYQKGFDQMLLVQGMKANRGGITLPSPEHFFMIALQSFAASWSIPLKVLVGTQAGVRASSEDGSQWDATCNSRRVNTIIPNIYNLVRRLAGCGIIRQADYVVDWTDLTESSMKEKVERADKMASVNQKLQDTGEYVFTPEEIRFSAGYEPLAEADKKRPVADHIVKAAEAKSAPEDKSPGDDNDDNISQTPGNKPE